MLSSVLPRQLDNVYRGSKVALWILGAVLLVKAAIACNSTFNGYYVATVADGLPLGAFTSDCARIVVADFATWGIAQLMICLLGILALVRYRAMVPLVFAVLLLESLARYLSHAFLPQVHGAQGASFVNPALLALLVIGLALSLWQGGKE